MKRLQDIRTGLERQDEGLQAYRLQGAQLAEFLGQAVARLESIAACQPAMTWSRQMDIYWQLLMGTVEGGLGTAVGLAGWWFQMPAMYMGFAGTVAGTLAFRQAYALSTRENFSSLDALREMQGLQTSAAPQPPWLYLGTTYTPPRGWRSQAMATVERRDLVPTRQRIEADLLFESADGGSLTVFFR